MFKYNIFKDCYYGVNGNKIIIRDVVQFEGFPSHTYSSRTKPSFSELMDILKVKKHIKDFPDGYGKFVLSLYEKD